MPRPSAVQSFEILNKSRFDTGCRCIQDRELELIQYTGSQESARVDYAKLQVCDCSLGKDMYWNRRNVSSSIGLKARSDLHLPSEDAVYESKFSSDKGKGWVLMNVRA